MTHWGGQNIDDTFLLNRVQKFVFYYCCWRRHTLPTYNSVTRWLYYYSIFVHLQQWQLAPWHKNAKVATKVRQILNIQKIAQIFLFFCRSGEISLNLVTLQYLQQWKIFNTFINLFCVNICFAFAFSLFSFLFNLYRRRHTIKTIVNYLRQSHIKYQ